MLPKAGRLAGSCGCSHVKEMLRSSPSKCARSQRLYVRGSVMPFGEDSRREFKGHRNLCVEELPRWCFVRGTSRRSRRAVSRSGRSGIVHHGYSFSHGGHVAIGPAQMYAHAHSCTSLVLTSACYWTH